MAAEGVGRFADERAAEALVELAGRRVVARRLDDGGAGAPLPQPPRHYRHQATPEALMLHAAQDVDGVNLAVIAEQRCLWRTATAEADDHADGVGGDEGG